ncbi:MAG: EF-hand domain-containing protein [Rhodopila sp.]|jgi:Ca2+-binding EF-hand superfamily protein
MTSRNVKLLQAVCVAVAFCGMIAMRAEAAPPLKPPLSALDPDKDGTVSLDEAKAAADKKFDALDTDHEGTLSLKETKGIFLKSTLPQADPDKDGTIDKAEWEAQVEHRFKAADTDRDGTLDARELASPAGKNLLRLLQ